MLLRVQEPLRRLTMLREQEAEQEAGQCGERLAEQKGEQEAHGQAVRSR